MATGRIIHGGAEVLRRYHGSDEIVRRYRGGEIIWEPGEVLPEQEGIFAILDAADYSETTRRWRNSAKAKTFDFCDLPDADLHKYDGGVSYAAPGTLGYTLATWPRNTDPILYIAAAKTDAGQGNGGLKCFRNTLDSANTRKSCGGLSDSSSGGTHIGTNLNPLGEAASNGDKIEVLGTAARNKLICSFQRHSSDSYYNYRFLTRSGTSFTESSQNVLVRSVNTALGDPRLVFYPGTKIADEWVIYYIAFGTGKHTSSQRSRNLDYLYRKFGI